MGVAEQGQFPVAMLHSVMMTHHSNTFETELRVEANMHTFPKTHLFGHTVLQNHWKSVEN